MHVRSHLNLYVIVHLEPQLVLPLHVEGLNARHLRGRHPEGAHNFKRLSNGGDDPLPHAFSHLATPPVGQNCEAQAVTCVLEAKS
eukprot:9045501-Pyramimonas_sp.AAC.3